MKSIALASDYKKILGDMFSPVQLYSKLRDRYTNSILLESSDYHGDEHSMSYICCDPIAKFILQNHEIQINWPDATEEKIQIERKEDVISMLTTFSQSFKGPKYDFAPISNGLLGYTSYNAVQYFEDIEIEGFKSDERRIPEMIYQLYRFIIAFDHFNNEMYLIENRPENEESKLHDVEACINNQKLTTYSFNQIGEESSNLTNEEYKTIVEKGIQHCQRGDVFQIVLSRRFEQQFEGDEFNVYRTLRSINPSPYLFYFDFGSFKLMGSSPEAQIVVKDHQATIHPIAGTFKRTGNDKQDYESAKLLFDDPKENSEHIMLVDLARNDLSRHGSKVTVETFKEIQYYSHVIHLVSKVTGQLDEGVKALQLFSDTFPAGTLSGAPKHMAMKLIDQYEKDSRGNYGGAIGHISFQGELNHAIMIRTFLSRYNKLYYQAGAGVVAKSNPESELQEVNNKLGALKKAVVMADERFGKQH